MTHAQRTAAACKLAAFVAAIVAGYSATHHPYYVVPGLIVAAFFLGVAASYGRDEQRQQARHAELDAAAAADEQLLPTDHDSRSAA
ncbi:hypothetical protein [Streptomyces sp. M92]|uniref:hypothetical protein n=1 Tax=Streptomyces sp. M92 TaxID=2944250 RepID=UPI0023494D40|nr:hypothetical protein [Streptomyces sp. M92]WCN06030.1 hypothetical protein M6G08_30305 [Streptomyces sp. M92]